jgi:DNA invertase Pin-like site-specific DNA recombinase
MSWPLDGIACVGYVRVSTDRQAGDTQTSVADQTTAITGLATRLGLTVGAWYQDEMSGGTVQQRPAMMRLLADCAASPRKANRPGAVLVLNDSRFGRFPDPEEATYWRVHLKMLGWGVRFVENDDTDNLTVRTVMRSIVSSQATQKRNDVRANAKRGSRGTAAQGFWGTRAPYGYRRAVVYPPGRERVLQASQQKAPDEKVMLTPHDGEAGIIHALYARYATGEESLASVTMWLREVAPNRKWTRAAVRFTLSNPAYLGDVVSGRVSGDHTERAMTPRRPESEWVIHRDAHPAIVTRTVASRVLEVLARNGTSTSRVRTDWVVSGIVHCVCGLPYVAGGSGAHAGLAPSRAYRCSSKSGLMADKCAYPGAIKKEWLEETVVSTLASVIGTPARRREIVAQLNESLAELRRAPVERAVSLEKETAEATRTRDRLVAAVADGTLTGDEAKARLTTVRRALARLEAQRDAIHVDGANQRALDAERDRIAALAMDFRRMARVLHGPALREFIRPWIAGAVFDAQTRVLTLDVRHIPDVSNGVLTHMPCLPCEYPPGRGWS